MVRELLRDVLPVGRKFSRTSVLSSRSSRGEGGDDGEERVSRRRSSRFLWVLVGVAVLVLFFVGSFALGRATVAVAVREEKLTVDKRVTLEPTGVSGVVVGVRYAVVTVEGDDRETLPVDLEKRMERKASGNIVVYNNHSSNAQRLIKNTRFESSDGLIFRIDQSIVVPGKRVVDGKTVPGSVEAVVYADVPGEEYNIGLTDFTIPGFRSDSVRYKNFYARSKTPMTGGFVGMVKTTAEEKIVSARERVREKLGAKLLAEARGKAGAEHIIFDGAYFTTSEAVAEKEEAAGKLSVGEKGIIRAVTIERAALASALTAGDPVLSKEPIEIPDLESLRFRFIKKPDVDELFGTLPLSVELEGDVTARLVVDERKLVTALAGRGKSDVPEILSEFPAIVSSEIVIRPFWRGTFPKNADRITIVREENSPSTASQ